MLEHSERWDFDLQSLRLEKHHFNSKIMNDLSFVSKVRRESKSNLELNISLVDRICQRKLYHKLNN